MKERLRERASVRRPTSLQIALADRIWQLDPASWTAVSAGQSFFFSRTYLETLQAIAPANVEPRFALVCRGDEARAFAHMYAIPGVIAKGTEVAGDG